MNVNYNIINNKFDKRLKKQLDYDDNPYIHLGENFDINVIYNQSTDIATFDCDGYLKTKYHCYDISQLDFLLEKYKSDYVEPSKESANLAKTLEDIFKKQYKECKRKQYESVKKLKEEIKNRNEEEELER